jgi:hypothetical protein
MMEETRPNLVVSVRLDTYTDEGEFYVCICFGAPRQLVRRR